MCLPLFMAMAWQLRHTLAGRSTPLPYNYWWSWVRLRQLFGAPLYCSAPRLSTGPLRSAGVRGGVSGKEGPQHAYQLFLLKTTSCLRFCHCCSAAHTVALVSDTMKDGPRCSQQ